MTVGDLIAKLTSADPLALVVVVDGDGDVRTLAHADSWGVEDIAYTQVAVEPGTFVLSPSCGDEPPARVVEMKDGSHVPPEVAERQLATYRALLGVTELTTEGR